MKKKFPKYADYKEKRLEDIFTEAQLKKAVKLDAYEMRTSLFLNNGKGGFTIKPLPIEAQFAPVYGIAIADFDRDGKQDILLGGNFYQSKPEAGIYDGSYGLFLKGNGSGNFESVPISESNFFVKGAIRDIHTLKTNKTNLVIITRNNEKVKVVQY